MPTLNVPSVTPTPGLVSAVATGGSAVTVFPANINGGFIQNPSTATEYLFVNAIDSATTTAQGNTFGIAPGGSWDAIPGQNTPTTCNAVSSGHAFSSTYW